MRQLSGLDSTFLSDRGVGGSTSPSRAISNRLDFGLLCDPDLVPDVDAMRDCILAELDTLTRAARSIPQPIDLEVPHEHHSPAHPT